MKPRQFLFQRCYCGGGGGGGGRGGGGGGGGGRGGGGRTLLPARGATLLASAHLFLRTSVLADVENRNAAAVRRTSPTLDVARYNVCVLTDLHRT